MHPVAKIRRVLDPQHLPVRLAHLVPAEVHHERGSLQGAPGLCHEVQAVQRELWLRPWRGRPQVHEALRRTAGGDGGGGGGGSLSAR